ncbi:MAG TPA: histidine kinase [Terracidiphilus sp.]|nr:histidine kinase [Terracidiphilus sp.]
MPGPWRNHFNVKLVALLMFASIAALGVRAAEPANRLVISRLQSIESAIESAGLSTAPVPVVVRGIVIANHRQVVIEDQTGATEIKPLTPEELALGDEVEVSGKVALAPQPEIQQAKVRRLWGGSMPLPLAVTPDEAANGENELHLVQTMAELVDVVPAGMTSVRLNLRGGQQSFYAVLPGDSPGGELDTKSMQTGATLRLTGVLMISYGQPADQGNAFSLVLRTPDDIKLVEPPSWWTPAHKLLLGVIGVILLLLGISIYYRVKHARYRAVAEERAGIARDIHDTLAQGFAGITLQLEAAQQMIGRDAERAGELLNEALQLIRHSRDESHLSIDILRSLSHTDRLDVLIRHCVLQKVAVTGTAIELETEGSPVPLSFDLVNNLFRITQEALANAIRHAGAHKIKVRLNYKKREVRLEVEDDGKGFILDQAPGPEHGHFGLTGIRERCANIGAQLELRSSAGGTLLGVRVGV